MTLSYLQVSEELLQGLQRSVLVADEILTNRLVFLLQNTVRLVGLLEKLNAHVCKHMWYEFQEKTRTICEILSEI